MLSVTPFFCKRYTTYLRPFGRTESRCRYVRPYRGVYYPEEDTWAPSIARRMRDNIPRRVYIHTVAPSPLSFTGMKILG